MTQCKNCGNIFEGNYCNLCGQSAQTHEINFYFLWHDLQHGLFHLDKGFPYTLYRLLLRPGHTAREFIEGKRVRHFKPLTFLIVSVGFYAFVRHFIAMPTSFLRAEGNVEVVHFISLVSDWMTSHYIVLALILLFILSLSLLWAFPRESYNILQYFVFVSYLGGLGFIFQAIALLVAFLMGEQTMTAFVWMARLVGFLFLSWAVFQFFEGVSIKKRITGFLKFYIFILLLSFCLLALTALFLALFSKSRVHLEFYL